MEITLPKTQNAAPIQEVFSSVQGEGVYVGHRQVFVRFAHCHLKCAYCDTAMTTEDGRFYAELSPGSPQTQAYDNPVSTETLLQAIDNLLAQGRHHSVSFTGGEPLLYHRFLKTLLEEFKKNHPDIQTYLETSGTQAAFLSEVLPWTDVIAMDIKLPSTTGERALFNEHQAFLAMAATRPEVEVFIKLVFGKNTTDEELAQVRETILDQTLPIILQPVTSLADHRIHLEPAHILRVQDQLARWFKEVRVIPQTHKMVQVR